MGQLDKFLRLPAADRRLLMQALLLVWVVRVGMWLLPFRTVRHLLSRLAQGSARAQANERTPMGRIVWAISVASKYVPMVTCLTQALATKVLLNRYGHRVNVRIGVARGEAGQLQAHAWVEKDGSIVIGGSEASLQQYIPLVAANGELL